MSRGMETGERLLGVDEFVVVALAIGVNPIALLQQALDDNKDLANLRSDSRRVFSARR
jgi:hypothetical protein